MPHNPIQPCVDDLLVILDFDGSGEIGVLPKYLGIQEIGCQKQPCSGPYGPIR